MPDCFGMESNKFQCNFLTFVCESCMSCVTLYLGLREIIQNAHSDKKSIVIFSHDTRHRHSGQVGFGQHLQRDEPEMSLLQVKYMYSTLNTVLLLQNKRSKSTYIFVSF